MPLIIALICFFLSSCHVKTVDEEKKNLNDQSSFSNQLVYQNRNEVFKAYSRYGNPYSYQVGSRTYFVLASANGYKAQGIASWYGPSFHKKKTSSGSDYNMFNMTAAHKTLPLPSMVRVTNLENGRKVTVNVNDRGPFVGDRIIDLSYAAAKKLGFEKKGTARVSVEAIKTNRKAGQYYIQAGAFISKKLADLFLEKLKKSIKSPIFIDQYNKHYQVKLGPFKNQKQSNEALRLLKKEGIHNSIVYLF